MIYNRWFRALIVITIFGIILSIAIMSARYVSVGINVSRSLPYTFFIIIHTKQVYKNNLVVFKVPHNKFISSKSLLLKRVIGIAGDRVSYLRSSMYINGRKVGSVLKQTNKGEKLHPGPTGTIPINKFYVSAPHLRSFDSRYAELGWIDQSQVLGKAIVVW